MNEVNATPQAELMAELMNPNNPKNEREHAAVREIERLQEALAKPVLQDIEQYRTQMAGISTAAIGYWKEGDGIHPDYDTLALRDVAKLYEKYDELYKAQDVSHGMIAGALFDFMAWLTSRPKRIMLSSADDASPAVDAIKDFAKMRGLSLDDAQVQTWQEALVQPEQEPVAWMHTSIKDNVIAHRPVDLKRHPERWTALYPAPSPCPTCEALARTVMLDQTYHDNFKQAQRPWVALTDEEIHDAFQNSRRRSIYQAIENSLKEKNT